MPLKINLENEALNGEKTLPILAVDEAGNQAQSQLQIELANPETPTELPLPPTTFIHVHPQCVIR